MAEIGATEKVAVLGAGAFGTTLAIILTGTASRVVLCARRHEHLEQMRSTQENAPYLPGVRLPPRLELTDQWKDAASTATAVVLAIPSRFARTTLAPVASAIPVNAVIISAIKGIEEDSLMTMSQMLAEAVPQVTRIAVLSGPGFAAELARGKPAALVAAAREEVVAREVQELFASRSLRIYRSADVIGVELGGAVKNVIAVAAGISDGLDLGSSARAGLITRGIAEMMRLAQASGARTETVAGLAGLGDLILTCTSSLSRNWNLGRAFAQGKKPPRATPGHPVAEAISNAAAVHKLARKLNVEMPIVAAVQRVLYEGTSASAMVDELLKRELKAEFGEDKAPRN